MHPERCERDCESRQQRPPSFRSRYRWRGSEDQHLGDRTRIRAQRKSAVINMNGSSFGTGPSCSVTEGGTPPNSVLVDSFTPGSLAVNARTHQAFITGLGDAPSGGAGNRVGLMSLPKKRVVQLKASMIKYVQSSIPNDPDGAVFKAQGFLTPPLSTRAITSDTWPTAVLFAIRSPWSKSI